MKKRNKSQCKAITKFGERCLMKAVIGDYCIVHYQENFKNDK